ncbi:MAG TPA: cytochrome ubiquinol oxidase subunit I [Solirubrobacteraceae bacterium]|nr:cytochrome ubiquinol oxidase subunit I [Solirubrobacteraceae bacterium]
MGAFAPVDQHYLLEARQMQALSFAVHIPLVCFGIAFPVMVLFLEWLGLRTGDRVYLTLARRWTRILATLFAVGVITGTVLSFEMGLLWPNFTLDGRWRGVRSALPRGGATQLADPPADPERSLAVLTSAILEAFAAVGTAEIRKVHA